MRPFLLLATRAEDEAADNEYAAFLQVTGLTEAELVRVRLEQRGIGQLDLDGFSGVLLGGSPFTSSDAPARKSTVQRRVEQDLAAVLDLVVAQDRPFFGACYGIGSLGQHQGAVVDGRYAEPVGTVPVSLSDHARTDPVFGVLPPRFDAFVGHKEAISDVPPHVVVLASSPLCPVQAFRVGRNVYATQFHPELDADGLCLRIETYKHLGYFAPEEAAGLKAMARASAVVEPPQVLRRFVDVHGRGLGVAAPAPAATRP
ncbi:glutamine amidotransferase [Nocardioides mesophilus]|uniref:Glutamine amidotransferase n=1 Tax=Nocardioides mesophilus TaxID=433659 RepID=A0A7G9R8I7_9ACTN|nr:glutamine amidotransferase [Nocardioides mesophilus]QNN51912.1 glutamine amidotransferase [Nocardioides mesophilus]